MLKITPNPSTSSSQTWCIQNWTIVSKKSWMNDISSEIEQCYLDKNKLESIHYEQVFRFLPLDKIFSFFRKIRHFVSALLPASSPCWCGSMQLHPQIFRKTNFAPTDCEEIWFCILHFVHIFSFWSPSENMHPQFWSPNEGPENMNGT